MDREQNQPVDRDDPFFTEVIDPTDTTTWAQNDVAAQVRDAITDPRLAIETMGEGPWPAAVTFTIGNPHVIVGYKAPGIGQIDRQSNLSDVLVHSPNIGGPHAPTPTFRFDQWRIDVDGHTRPPLDTLDPADIRSSSPMHDRSDAVQAVTTWARTEFGYLDTGHQDIARTLHHTAEPTKAGTRSSAELPAIGGGSGSCTPALPAHLSRTRTATSVER